MDPSKVLLRLPVLVLTQFDTSSSLSMQFEGRCLKYPVTSGNKAVMEISTPITTNSYLIP